MGDSDNQQGCSPTPEARRYRELKASEVESLLDQGEELRRKISERLRRLRRLDEADMRRRVCSSAPMGRLRRRALLLRSGLLEGRLRDGSGAPLFLYHGSSRQLDSFDPARGSEYGIYLSPQKRYASLYGKWIHVVTVEMDNPLYVWGKGAISPKDLAREDVERLESEGYDGIIVTDANATPNPELASEVVAFRPEQIRLITVQEHW